VREKNGMREAESAVAEQSRAHSTVWRATAAAGRSEFSFFRIFSLGGVAVCVSNVPRRLAGRFSVRRFWNSNMNSRVRLSLCCATALLCCRLLALRCFCYSHNSLLQR